MSVLSRPGEQLNLRSDRSFPWQLTHCSPLLVPVRGEAVRLDGSVVG